MGGQNRSGEAMAIGEADVDLSCGVDDTRRAVDEGPAEALLLPAQGLLRKGELSKPRLEVVR